MNIRYPVDTNQDRRRAKTVWTQWRREKFLAPAGKRTPIVQPVA
jgi:hypothetical protein